MNTTAKADHAYIMDALAVEDSYDEELSPLRQQLFTGGLTPEEYELARGEIAAQAAVRLAAARRRHEERNS